MNKADHNNLHVGDTVLTRNDKRSNKLSSAFSHEPMFVTDIRGTVVTAVDDNHALDPAKYFSFQEGTRSTAVL